MSVLRVSKRKSDETVSLEWSNLNFFAYVRDGLRSKFMRPVFQERHILKGISGSAHSKQLVAIMGPTGCGKTSLLNILSARVPSGGATNFRLTGSVSVNSINRDDEKFRKVTAYVVQDDLLYAHLTVHETISLAANFFLPDDLDKETRETVINDTITELGLIKCAHTIVGNERLRGISGGERKRTAIAVQLITDPAVLFLDEPTTGLDSFQALSVMESMKELVTSGRLVISVIHQPRSSIFAMFDQLILLSEGHTIFQGKADLVVAYFNKFSFSCPLDYNPADYFLDILSPDSRTTEKDSESEERILFLAQQWQKEQINDLSGSSKTFQASTTDISQVIVYRGGVARWWRIFLILLWRSWTDAKRNKFANVIKVMNAIIFAFVLGGISSNTGNGQVAYRNKTGLIMFVVINNSFGPLLAVVNTFPKEKIIVNRERNAGAYDPVSYFVAKFLAELPFTLLGPTLYSIIVYWIADLQNEAGHFFIFTATLMLLSVNVVTLGLAISAFAPSMEVASTMGAPFLVIGILFSGYYMNINSLPPVAIWIPNLSPLRWAFEALVINELKGETYSCDGLPPESCISTGHQALQRFTFGGKNVGDAVLGLCVLLAIYFGAAIAFLIRSRIVFISLGHEGAKAKALARANRGDAGPGQGVHYDRVVVTD